MEAKRVIVLTRNTSFQALECDIAHDLTGIEVESEEGEEFWVLGGAETFQAFFPITNNIFVNRVHSQLKGDTLFPEWNLSGWDHYCDPLNMIAEPDPLDEYPWSVEDFSRRGL
jgi:dihydrofolate reductase